MDAHTQGISLKKNSELKEPKCFTVGNEHGCHQLHSKTPSPPSKMVMTDFLEKIVLK